MTAQKAMQMSEVLLKLLVPLFIAVCSFALQSVRSELRELRVEIRAMRAENQELLVRVALLESSSKRQ
jgi:hypothetical protein